MSASGDGAETPRFTTGPTMRHVVIMAAAGTIGLMALFLVDLANLLYISLLGDPKLTAAVGFATTIIFFFVSLNVGMSIAGTALVSRALGAGDRDKARRLAGSALTLVILFSGGLSLATLPFSRSLLMLLGATGETLDIAHGYLIIVLPSSVLLGMFMALGGIMRAIGDARRSMFVTLLYGLTTAILDPIFIFTLDMGVTGAAVVAIIARVATVAYGLYVVVGVHRLIAAPSLAAVLTDFRPLAGIGGPAVLTNIATPVGNGYVTSAISEFGDPAVAGWTIVSRLIPVCFAALFALSGAIGPILGQNFGAGLFDRVRRVFTDGLLFSMIYLAGISLALFLLRNVIVAAFGVEGEAAELVLFFCSGMAAVFGMVAVVFVANAAFNNLGYPLLSTVFNWGRATLGTVPFVMAGAHFGGAKGAIAGFSIGSVPFGIVAVLVCYAVIARMGEPDPRGSAVTNPPDPPSRS